MSKKYTKSTWK